MSPVLLAQAAAPTVTQISTTVLTAQGRTALTCTGSMNGEQHSAGVRRDGSPRLQSRTAGGHPGLGPAARPRSSTPTA